MGVHPSSEEDERRRTQSTDDFQRDQTRFPNREVPKINPESVAYFSSPENVPRKHHVCHAYHHKLTTKTPRFGTPFCQNPQQNR